MTGRERKRKRKTAATDNSGDLYNHYWKNDLAQASNFKGGLSSKIGCVKGLYNHMDKYIIIKKTFHVYLKYMFFFLLRGLGSLME